MKVILLEDVPKLGRRGEVREVSDGYARNFLLPQKLALGATAGNLRNLDLIKANQEGRAARLRNEAQAQADAVEALSFVQSRQASEEGRLFGSVGKADVVAFLTQHGISVEKRRVVLDEPIKSVGDYVVPIRLHGDVTANLKVSVTRE
jgi:large subunit ribosomal protein L9